MYGNTAREGQVHEEFYSTPFKVEDFLHFARETGLDRLYVENLTHWKVVKWPFYHEFITVTTLPGGLRAASSAPLSRLPQDAMERIASESMAHGVSFRIDRGRRWAVGARKGPEWIGSQQEHIDNIRIINNLSPPLRGRSEGFEELFIMNRKPSSTPTKFSLRVDDICTFVNWCSQVTPSYDLFKRNCWSLAASLVFFTLHHQFDHDFDTEERLLEAYKIDSEARTRIRDRLRNFFARPSGAAAWLQSSYELETEEVVAEMLADSQAIGWSAEEVTSLPRLRMEAGTLDTTIQPSQRTDLMRHPDRGRMGLLLNEIGSLGDVDTLAKRWSTASDESLDHICRSIEILSSHWSKFVHADPVLSETYGRVIQEFLRLVELRGLTQMESSLTSYLSALWVIHTSGWRVKDDGVGAVLSTCLVPSLLEVIRGANDPSDYTLTYAFFLVQQLVSYPEELQALISNDVLDAELSLLRRRGFKRHQIHIDRLIYTLCDTSSHIVRTYLRESQVFSYIAAELSKSSQSHTILIEALSTLLTSSMMDFNRYEAHLSLCEDLEAIGIFSLLIMMSSRKTYAKRDALLIRQTRDVIALTLKTKPLSLRTVTELGRMLNDKSSSAHNVAWAGEVLASLGKQPAGLVLLGSSLTIKGLCRVAYSPGAVGAINSEKRNEYITLLEEISRIKPELARIVSREQRRYNTKV